MKKGYIVLAVLFLLALGSVSYWFLNCSFQVTEEQYLELFELQIDEVLENYDLTNEDYIAIDANTFNISSQSMNDKLIYDMRKYNKNIIIAPYSLINSDSELSEDGVLKGIIISAANIERKGNKVSNDINIYKAPLNEKGYTYKSKFILNKWNLKVTSKQVS